MPSNVEELNPLEIEGIHSQIRFFGQCPIQLFGSSPQGLGHPHRHVRIVNAIPRPLDPDQPDAEAN